MTQIVKFIITIALMASFAHTAEAASLFFKPGEGTYGVGKNFTVDLKVDSEGAGLNAAQATIRFPKETLQVVSIDKAGSAFSFWLQDPTFSNGDGIISFVGGTPYGISGASIQVLRITFTSKGSGAAPLSITDAALTASDGSGTNILSKTGGASFTISTETISTTTTPAVVPTPVQITRTPEPATGLPVKPIVTVALYPDEKGWSNASDIFTAHWALPADISGIKTALNKQPNFVPDTTSEGLFENKAFAALEDGTWYLHVRFKNSIGWGPTAHYRIAVDTVTPLPFDITSPDNNPTDNPTPLFVFKTNDALSGIKDYQIKVDNEGWMTIPVKDFPGSYKLSLANPGKHHIIIRAFDYAGNSVENSIDHETTPIASPAFTFSTERLYVEDATGLTFKGTASPKTEVLLSIKQGDAILRTLTVPVGDQGDWELTFNEPIKTGTYTATIQNRDARGALSLIVTSPAITVTGKYTTLIMVTIAILIIVIAGGYWYARRQQQKVALRLNVAESDAAKVFKMIETDMEKLHQARTTPTLADDEFIAKKISAEAKKMGDYVQEEIKKAQE